MNTILGEAEQNLDPRETYSAKLQGRLRHAFDGSKLMIVAGDFDGQVMKARHMMPHLPPNPFSAISADVGVFNKTLPEVVGRMVLSEPKSAQKTSYIQGVGGYDMDNLVRISIDTASQNGNQEKEAPVIRVVYGATEEMPFRALSYITPALSYMENFQDGMIDSPQLQVIFAHNISGALNRMDQERVKVQTMQFATLARVYTKKFFPSLVGKVVFAEDTSLDHGSVLRNELIEIAKEARERTPEDVRDALLQKGGNGGKPINLYYGAAHILLHDVHIPDGIRPLFTDQPVLVDPKAIISMGGSQEQLFYKLRHTVKPFLDHRFRVLPTAQFFTRHLVPPYSMAKDDETKTVTADISLDRVLQDPSARLQHDGISKAAIHNLAYLEVISQGRGVNFTEFLEAMKGKTA